MHHFYTIAFLGFALIAPRAEATSNVVYRCVAEDSVGFISNGGRWNHTRIIGAPGIYEVRVENLGSGPYYSLVQTSERGSVQIDSRNVSDSPSDNWLMIGGTSTAGQLFTLRRSTMKFSFVYTASYGLDHRDSTPYMTIGTCRKLGNDPHPDVN